MGSSREEIAKAAGIPIENLHPLEPGLHIEIIDTSNMQVWQTMANVTYDDYAALQVEAPYRKVGIGGLAAYCSFFRRSPNADSDGAMESMDYGEHHFSRCASPVGAPSFPAGPDGPRLMSINKHHSIVYTAGRDLHYLESPDGDAYVHVVGTGQARDALKIPEGWMFRVARIEKETIIHLPCPTSVLFFDTDAGLESYQGPVSPPR